MAIDPRTLGPGGPGLPPAPPAGAPTAPPGVSEGMAKAPGVAEQPDLMKALLGLSVASGAQNVGDRIAQLLSRIVQISDELTKLVSDNPQYLRALRAVMSMVGTKGPTGKRKAAGEASMFDVLSSTPSPVPPSTPAAPTPPSPSGHPVVIE